MRNEESIKTLLDNILFNLDISNYTKTMLRAVLLWVLDDSITTKEQCRDLFNFIEED